MRRTLFRFMILGAALALGSVAMAQTAAGHWEGRIHLTNPQTGKTRELGITVDLAKDSKGVWIGSMSVTESSAIDVPLTSVTVEDTMARFTASLPQNASFAGRLSADGNSLSGTASSASGEAPFDLKRNGQANVQVPPPSSLLSKEFQGVWEGSIDVGGKTKRVVLKLSPASDGTASATLTSVDEGNLEIPVTTVTLQDAQLQLEARSVSGKYRGSLGATGEIAGEWIEGSGRFPLTFKHSPSDAKKP